MAKKDDILEGLDKEEDLFDFDLEDITPEDLAGADLGPDEDVIELVDLVEEGSREPGEGNEEIISLLEEDDSEEALEDITISTDEISAIPDILGDEAVSTEDTDASVADLSLSDLEQQEQEVAVAEELLGSAIEEAPTRALEPDIDDEVVVERERPEVEIDLSGLFDEESTEKLEADQEARADSEDNVEAILEETIEGIVAEEEIPREEMVPERVPQVEPAPEGPEGGGASGTSAGGPAISEERIEAIVSEVVQEVVERVARETMATVAERLITEAIEALKQSLKSSYE